MNRWFISLVAGGLVALGVAAGASGVIPLAPGATSCTQTTIQLSHGTSSSSS
jgi:hypothetical protein